MSTGDEELREEARKAVGELDLAAWERVRLLMLRRGAVETEESAAERTRIAETFLRDVKTLGDAVLGEAATGNNLYGGAATEAELLRSLLDAVDFEHYPGSHGSKIEYVRSGQVALALNRAFGITGWDLRIDSLRFLERPFRSNTLGRPNPDGAYWTASAIAVVTLRVHGPAGRTCERQDVGVSASSPFTSRRGSDEAAKSAISGSVREAFKNAARFMGPATGLTLNWSKPLKEEVRAQIEADLRRCVKQ